VSNLLYVAGAAAFVVVASLILWVGVLLGRRPKPDSSYMDDFNRGLQALAPPPRVLSGRVRARRGSSAG
jgi:hypothetical protein